ncbi:hypothetical protein P8605_08735 [Streptomyces sp. T-3]|nr:hypothetical protein [Streptomyces sp. T-3]
MHIRTSAAVLAASALLLAACSTGTGTAASDRPTRTTESTVEPRHDADCVRVTAKVRKFTTERVTARLNTDQNGCFDKDAADAVTLTNHRDDTLSYRVSVTLSHTHEGSTEPHVTHADAFISTLAPGETGSAPVVATVLKAESYDGTLTSNTAAITGVGANRTVLPRT